jgi:replicative DNA helicase Mcm
MGTNSASHEDTELPEKALSSDEQISRFKEFIEEVYMNELMANVSAGNDYLVIDFAELSKYDLEMADFLLDEPEEMLRAAELAVRELNVIEKKEDQNRFHVRMKNLPKSREMKIRNIRSKNLNKFIFIRGTVRQKSDVRPRMTSAKFECPSCGNIISVFQTEKKIREPSKCAECGRKGRFRLLSKELIDAQGIVLEESSEALEGGEQPKRMNVLLKDDLVSPISDKRTNPGTKIIVNGMAKEEPIVGRDGGKLTRFDLLYEANYVEAAEEDFDEIKISREDKKQIIALAKDKKIYEKMTSALAPSIYGYTQIKEALLFQLFGGIRKERDDGVVTRGDMHILLIGDPGAGKSQLLKRMAKIAPRARFISGKGASGAGLTATVVKDEFLNGWALEAGAMVLANKGFCMIDELDKMSAEDTSAMHEALEGQTVTISKASIQATLRTQTAVLAAANPKFGRFDPYEDFSKQIDLPLPLINRFDLIFPVRDLPSKERDEVMAKFILTLHKTSTSKSTELDTEFIRKYISYSRQHCKPELTDDAIDEVKNYYVQMRNSGSSEGGMKAISISARQLEGLIRLSEASAKIRLAKNVNREDARRAINLLHYSLSQIGIDPETGKIDLDRITTGVSTSQRSKIIQIKEIIQTLEDMSEDKTVKIEDLEKAAAEKNISDSVVDEALQKLKRSGDIYEPKRNVIKRM